MKIFSWIGRHRWLALFIGTGLTCMSCPIWILVAPINARINRKSSAWYSPDPPSARAGAAQPILQLESHTCGLLTLSAAYTLYDLQLEEKNLRYRLGVDVPANPLDSSSTGTLHPDLLRVLVQDGFTYEMPSPFLDADVRLRNHLQTGNVALILIRRRETGGLHWVLADALDGDSLRIVDSLQTLPVTEPIADYFNHRVLSAILIKPNPSFPDPLGSGPAVAQAHGDGAAEMVRVKQRLDRFEEADN